MAEPSDDPFPAEGDVVGGYRVSGLLAVGGTAKVYMATATDGTLVALKVVKPELARDATFRVRFAREAAIAERVSHPHVVTALASGENRGLPYLVQAFVSGGSLADRLEREGRLGLAATLEICDQVAGGLGAMHAAGLIHRDVKPANILFDGDGAAHITDFGLARDNDAQGLTRPGQTMGSLDYMSPEQIHGDAVGPATDVYALACVICECLCGAPPFGAVEGLRVLWAHLSDPPPDPCVANPGLPRAVGDVILQGLAKTPDERPQSAAEFAAALRTASSIA